MHGQGSAQCVEFTQQVLYTECKSCWINVSPEILQSWFKYIIDVVKGIYSLSLIPIYVFRYSALDFGININALYEGLLGSVALKCLLLNLLIIIMNKIKLQWYADYAAEKNEGIRENLTLFIPEKTTVFSSLLLKG